MNQNDIRSAIESNPQSQDMRRYLIGQAVENDMADEIPDEWTVDLYNPGADEAYDDSLDLIADEYKFSDYLTLGYVTDAIIQDPQSDVVISAHESGAVSIRIAPQVEPVAKFDVGVTDQLVELLTRVQDWEAYNNGEQAPPEGIEPITGISVTTSENVRTWGDRYSKTEMVFTLTIPDEAPHEFVINDTVDIWKTGLTAMANAAETYGRQDIPDD